MADCLCYINDYDSTEYEDTFGTSIEDDCTQCYGAVDGCSTCYGSCNVGCDNDNDTCSWSCYTEAGVGYCGNCDSSCDGNTPDCRCNDRKYDYDCRCNHECYEEGSPCTCDTQCYEEGIECGCYSQCDGFTACNLNTCDGYVACSCDNTCYQEGCLMCHFTNYSDDYSQPW